MCKCVGVSVKRNLYECGYYVRAWECVSVVKLLFAYVYLCDYGWILYVKYVCNGCKCGNTWEQVGCRCVCDMHVGIYMFMSMDGKK